MKLTSGVRGDGRDREVGQAAHFFCRRSCRSCLVWQEPGANVIKHFSPSLLTFIAGNTKRGKYHCTIDLLFDWFGISCWPLTIIVSICKIDYSKPVKQEVNGTVLLRPLVFPAHSKQARAFIAYFNVYGYGTYYRVEHQKDTTASGHLSLSKTFN